MLRNISGIILNLYGISTSKKYEEYQCENSNIPKEIKITPEFIVDDDYRFTKI